VTTPRTADYLVGLLRELCKLPRETEWAEFKVGNTDPREIGEQISALANSAALTGKALAYLVWGVEDVSHQIVGTQFVPAATKVGNEELESWLLHLLSPKIEFRFFEVEADGKRAVILEIERARGQPVQFQGEKFIRVGTYKKKLKDFPEKERALWRIFDLVPFEGITAAEHVSDDDVLKLLDHASYFDLVGRPAPGTKQGVLDALVEDAVICACDAGGWNITNLGAVLFAKRLDQFAGLSRKAMRVIVYPGNSRIETSKEQVGAKGYASGFEGLISFINGLVPSNEVIQQALRKTVPMYPELAVRELVVNVLIHQDFSVTGAGPMVEIFSDRMEITNPGQPLMATDRFLDTPPKSRNEALASLMRRMGICEERGSGVDKVVFQTELFQLPAPLFEVTGESTRAVLFAHRPLTKMDKEDRVRACYLHACLKYVNREHLTNTTVRERFGIEAHNIATASRLIKEAVEAGAIKPVDPDSAKSHRRYVPRWVEPSETPEESGP
jgi:predicted HTH transcriptional regulator